MATTTFPVLSAEEAADLVEHGSMLGLSGFTAAGAPKAVPIALAARAKRLHAQGKPFGVRVISGASAGACDDALADAGAVLWRAPFQSSKPLRDGINAGTTEYLDMHLSDVPQRIEFGFLGPIDLAVIEATEVTPDGRVYLTTGTGISPTLLRHARRVIIEINSAQSPRLAEMHDIARIEPPPQRGEIPISHPMDRIGVPYAAVDPRKIVGVVRTNEPDASVAFAPSDDASRNIAKHVVEFLLNERAAGRIPQDFLPLQAGVGNVSNAVMAAVGAHPDIPHISMYTEVLQDAQIDMLESGRLRGASTCALALSSTAMRRVFDRMDFFAPRIILRPQELSNNPGIVRRLGVITMNTVLEMDIFGNANSTHVCGTQMVNGIGGSGDFTRNAYLSILMAPSIAKGGKISAVVPMVSHVDNNEHSVQVLVTEQGLADLRGLDPKRRAERIINQCAHPDYRPYLLNYLERCKPGHLRHDLLRCFDLHRNLMEKGRMLEGVGG
ncbi:MAG: acetyl-CoA hydrolase/transferase family protein [Phycisphaerales bacterium]|nr:acetyl-CoA hydrolase/transferase family protein [Phycisphaerales bacterium]